MVKDVPVEIERGSASGRALVEGKIVHIPDVREDADYTFNEALKTGEFRTVLAVPMLREGVAIGVLALTRKDVRPFTEKQFELVTTFADQAAIAIENVRLFESVETSDARTGRLAGGFADRAGPPRTNGETGLARAAYRRDRARDQEPAQFREQFFRNLPPK